VELTAYLALLRRCWAAVLACALLGGALGVLVSFQQAPRYQATASVFLSPGQGQSVGELAQGSSYTQGLVQSYVRLVTTPAVLTPVIQQLQLDTTPEALAKDVSAQVELETVLIDITAVSGSARGSADIANAVSAQLSRTTTALAPSAARGTTAIDVTTVAPATPPSFPFSPDRRLDLAIGAAAGLLLAVGGALVREVLDSNVRTPDDVADLTDAPVLAGLGQSRRTAAARAARGVAVRRLRTAVRHRDADGGSRQVAITSAGTTGTTGLSLELARAAADAETRVLLVEGDLRHPGLAALAGLREAPGLVEVLRDGAGLGTAVQPAGPGLDVLVAGRGTSDPDALLGSRALVDLLQTLRGTYDVVLVDAPPVAAVADTAVLCARLDGTVLVAETRRTTRPQLQDTLRDLAAVGAPVLGVVLDHGRRRASRPVRTAPPAPAPVATGRRRSAAEGGGDGAALHRSGT